ncbi:MAG: D-alanyl-D-alanine carboxypeptidase/D-alanyl-D-alanine-endopeptidase [Ignavibacteriaceae bacterium]|nr:D-alanyl-D-alanine carboxypeptidase/D-alanyl-D-alanine-endopeptidase [Ignavibacteriaceae bacterium]
MANKYFIIFILLFFSSLSAQEVVKKDSLPRFSYSTLAELRAQLEDIFNDPNFSNAEWGVFIQSLETGEYFYKKNEDKLLMPASNLKLFTTAAGLILLGSEYKFKTNIYSRGSIDGSILRGDLIVQGRGDPTISGRFYKDDMLKVFNIWIDSLLEIGIDEIDGNLIGDDTEFDDLGLGAGWSWDYESNWFAAQSSAISFNDNCIDIVLKANKKTKQPLISFMPETKYAVIINKVNVVSGDSATNIDAYRERGTNVITVFGSINLKDSIKIFVTVNNPTQYAMVVLQEVLNERGIKVTGYPIDIDNMTKPLDYKKLAKLFTHYSVPLKEIVKVINKNSQNFFAEQLLKTIGLEKEGFGTIENGVTAADVVFEEMGINPDRMMMVDGSGLSRLNLVTPRQIVTLLNHMYKSDVFIPFYNTLPIAGIDGTIGTRMKGTRAENNVRGKTGYLGSARSLSGYVFTGDGELLSFSVIANNFNVPYKLVDNIQDLVCLRLANFKRKLSEE